MSVHLILVTHGKIGKTMLAAASLTFGQLPLPTTTLAVSSDCDAETLGEQLCRLIERLNNDDGILLLTDLFGATPCNIACNLPKQDNIRIVCGLNLPMLIRIMNYATLELEPLTEKAVTGGQAGIMLCE